MDGTGTLLGTVTFTGETASGWQQATFTTPMAVQANTTYVASYYAPNAPVLGELGYFVSAGVTNGPLTALANGVDGGNGVYRYGSAGRSSRTTRSRVENYWVDVVFVTTVGPDTTAPTVTSRTPAVGATGVAVGSTVTATFSEPVYGAAMSVTPAGGSAVAGAVGVRRGVADGDVHAVGGVGGEHGVHGQRVGCGATRRTT